MISRPWLGAVTHIAGCPEREIDVTAAGTCPIIFPAATYKQIKFKCTGESYLKYSTEESYLKYHQDVVQYYVARVCIVESKIVVRVKISKCA